MAKTGKAATPEEQVWQYITAEKMIKPGETLLTAVSGGPDSVCLLHILAQLRRQLDIRLWVAHLDHQLRGAAGAADAEYVARLAELLDMPVIIGERDVEEYRKKHRLSLEEAAREVRYDFLAQVAADIGAAKVAVGHTRDDQSETILMNLIRGSGIRGLRGLRPVSRWPYPAGELTLIRPLLVLSREETVAYCEQHKLHPCTDASNASLLPFRNRIRHELLPQLRSYNPRINEALQRTADLAADDLDFIAGAAAGVRDKIIKKEGDIVVFDKASLSAVHPALQRHLLRGAVRELLGSLKDIETQHIEEIIKALSKPAGKKIGLPAGLVFTIEYDRYLLGFSTAEPVPLPVLKSETALKIPGITNLPGWNVTAEIVEPPAVAGKRKKADEYTACFDLDKTGDRLTVRRRRPGDRFQPLGMSDSKKLNQFMIDVKIPQSWRQRIPIVAAGERILWVVGWRIDERVKVTGDTRRVLRLKFERL